ncbi:MULTISPECIES: hypothetical protein [Moorena]|uniref:hypothetical protein n=1 Tax=Moorena TaxID=1155738 RepID=UPI00192BC28C|nr:MULTISPECIES: hypothetical protein [Moorena]
MKNFVTNFSGVGNRESGIGSRESGIGNRESGIGNRESGVRNVVEQASCLFLLQGFS